jgi:hypothetical protein
MFVLLDRTFLLTMYKRYAAKNEMSMVRMFEESLSRKSIKSKNNLYINMWHKYNSNDISPKMVNILSMVLYLSKKIARSKHRTGVMIM